MHSRLTTGPIARRRSSVSQTQQRFNLIVDWGSITSLMRPQQRLKGSSLQSSLPITVVIPPQGYHRVFIMPPPSPSNWPAPPSSVNHNANWEETVDQSQREGGPGSDMTPAGWGHPRSCSRWDVSGWGMGVAPSTCPPSVAGLVQWCRRQGQWISRPGVLWAPLPLHPWAQPPTDWFWVHDARTATRTHWARNSRWLAYPTASLFWRDYRTARNSHHHIARR